MRILLVEDDEKLNQSLAFQLEAEGFHIDSCRDGEEALYYIGEHIHDLILLDRMLPRISGTEVLQKMRKDGNQTPVILITALGTLDDKVTGLDLGADDYLAKPFGMMEMVSRVKAVLRRYSPKQEKKKMAVGGLEIDLEQRTATADGNGFPSPIKNLNCYACLCPPPVLRSPEKNS